MSEKAQEIRAEPPEPKLEISMTPEQAKDAAWARLRAAYQNHVTYGLPPELEATVRALHDEHWPMAQCDRSCSHMERLREAMRVGIQWGREYERAEGK